MNFTALILEFLKQNGSATFPGFGTFFLKKSNAVLDQDGKSILPPGARYICHQYRLQPQSRCLYWIFQKNTVRSSLVTRFKSSRTRSRNKYRYIHQQGVFSESYLFVLIKCIISKYESESFGVHFFCFSPLKTCQPIKLLWVSSERIGIF